VTVEKLLGEKGLICLNDLSDEIYNLGTNFNDAIGILSTFKLSSPQGSYETNVLKTRNEIEDKKGFVGNEMDLFLEKVL
jgi:large subunit ribosomal protein L7e